MRSVRCREFISDMVRCEMRRRIAGIAGTAVMDHPRIRGVVPGRGTEHSRLDCAAWLRAPPRALCPNLHVFLSFPAFPGGRVVCARPGVPGRDQFRPIPAASRQSRGLSTTSFDCRPGAADRRGSRLSRRERRLDVPTNRGRQAGLFGECCFPAAQIRCINRRKRPIKSRPSQLAPCKGPALHGENSHLDRFETDSYMQRYFEPYGGTRLRLHFRRHRRRVSPPPRSARWRHHQDVEIGEPIEILFPQDSGGQRLLHAQFLSLPDPRVFARRPRGLFHQWEVRRISRWSCCASISNILGLSNGTLHYFAV
jgi:hypothetical protein